MVSRHGYRVLCPLACTVIHSGAIKSDVTQTSTGERYVGIHAHLSLAPSPLSLSLLFSLPTSLSFSFLFPLLLPFASSRSVSLAPLFFLFLSSHAAALRGCVCVRAENALARGSNTDTHETSPRKAKKRQVVLDGLNRCRVLRLGSTGRNRCNFEKKKGKNYEHQADCEFQEGCRGHANSARDREREKEKSFFKSSLRLARPRRR